MLNCRGLSGPNAPPGCDGLTEWSVREATSFLRDAGPISRCSPAVRAVRRDVGTDLAFHNIGSAEVTCEKP